MEKSQAVAARLPVEIIQSILNNVDVESYLAARSTCQRWRYAASAPCMLRRVLQQTPVLLPPETWSLTATEWNRYFDQIARLNLLSYRTNVQKTVSKLSFPSSYMTSNVQASSSSGHITVVLDGRRIRVYSYLASWEFQLDPTLYARWESLCAAWIGYASASYRGTNERHARYCLAVSSRGDILAVALGQMIQIYSLRRDESREFPAEFILNQTNKAFHIAPRGHYEDTDGIVRSLEFTDDDTLLRVFISHETTSHRPTRVRYLGNPDRARDYNISVHYWQASLNHIYLDSVALSLHLVSRDARRCIVRGLRLLPPTFQIHSQHRHHHHHHRYHTRKKSRTDDTTRYFMAGLQTHLIDGYAIGSINPEAEPTAQVRIHRVLPSRYYFPWGPQVSSSSSSSNNNNNNNTVTYAPPLPFLSHQRGYKDHSNPPVLTTLTYTPITPENTIPQTISYNLRLAHPRWAPTNLPCSTFSFPLLATSADNRLAVIYEPGGPHSRFSCTGGSLYVLDISSCTPIFQPYAPARSAANAGPTNSTAAWLQQGGIEGPQDIIHAWPFLLDQVPMDIDAVGVEMYSTSSSSSSSSYSSSSSSSPSSPSSSAAAAAFSPSSSSPSPTSSTPASSISPQCDAKPPPATATTTRYTVWAVSKEKKLKLEWELGGSASSSSSER